MQRNEPVRQTKRPSFLVKTNYLNHYLLRLLMGNILLTVPTLWVAMYFLIWGKLSLLWMIFISSSIGIILIYPSLNAIPRPSKERVAVDALMGGLATMVILCCVLVIATPLKEKDSLLRDQSFLIPKLTGKRCDSKDSIPKVERLG